MRITPVIIGLGILLLIGATRSAIAQVTTGTILGTVKDQSAAVLPQVSITVTNVGTGISRSAITGSRGEYRIPALSVGAYEVQAELVGFQSSLHRGITLSVGREAVIDFTLQVGSVAEQVTVTGEAPLLEITTATVSGVVSTQQIRDIPLNARSFIDLIPLQTGAVFAEAGNTDSSSWGLARKVSVVGTRFNANSFLLDGADINNTGGVAGTAAGTMAGVETVREFRVITNAYDTSYGRHSGAVVSAVTKSGTNEFHGSLFEFLRNDNMDAPKWEDNAFANGAKREFRRNQFGGSLGGPIVKDKTFFFGSYEGLRQLRGANAQYDVPGMSTRNGILLGAPTSISAKTKPFLESYPIPNVQCSEQCLGSQYPYDRRDGTARFTKATNPVTDQDYYMARADNRLSDADSFFGRYNTEKTSQNTPGFLAALVLGTKSRFVTLEETHIFSPRLLATSHFSFNRTVVDDHDELLGAPNPQYPDNFTSFDGSGVLGVVSVTSLTPFGGNGSPHNYTQNVFQFKENFNSSKGRHAFKFGAEYERIQLNEDSPFQAGGTFSFPTLDDFFAARPTSFAYMKVNTDGRIGPRQRLAGFFLQDDISVRRGFTLNLGFRYEFITVPTEVNGKIPNIRDITEPHINTVDVLGIDIGDPYFENPSLKNFAPRIGIAWDPFGNGKTSVRAGIGIFHDQILPGAYRSVMGTSPPFQASVTVQQQNMPPGITLDFPRALLSQSNILGAFQGGGAESELMDGFQYQAEQPAVYKWSFDIQRELAGGVTFDVGYSGTRSTHLMRVVSLDVTPSTFIAGRRFLLLEQDTTNTNFGRLRWRYLDGISDYHGLRLSLAKRFSRGYQFQLSYTFSKTTDDTSSYLGSGDFVDGADRTPYGVDKEHGISALHVQNSFSANAVMNLPHPGLGRVADKIFGGWSLSSLVRLNSGVPFSLTATRGRVGTRQAVNAGGSTLDLKPDGDANSIRPQNPDVYFDVSQFLFPPVCSAASCNPRGVFVGNLARNHMIGPGIANVDITLRKEAQLSMLGENSSIEFRAEFFNLFNRPNFLNPARNLFNQNGAPVSTAGRISNTRESVPSRQIQLALRIAF
jgi:hypothetical protein